MSLRSSDPLVIEDTTNVWFTSDLHFGHARILEYCDRPYADVYEMNGDLIRRFNMALDENSTLINLGDVTINHHYLWAMREIKGTHILIPGNHDAIWPAHKKRDKEGVMDAYTFTFEVIAPLHQDLILGDTHFLMSHLPYNTDPHHHDKHEPYRPADQGLPLICGHVHTAWQKSGTQFNVGVDVNNFKPVPASEVLEWAKGL